jgi:hypothetical protein
MTHQTLQNKDTQPPGGFRYLQQDTGVWVKAASWEELIKGVRAHRNANNIPCGIELEQEVETQLCSTLPPGNCNYATEKERKRAKMIGRPSMSKFLELTRVLAEMHGNELVDKATANQHAEICRKCHYNQRPDGCTSCAMSDLVGLLSRFTLPKTEHDAHLHGCMLCGCSLRAKVHFPAEALARSAQDIEAFPEWCWIKQAQQPVAATEDTPTTG